MEFFCRFSALAANDFFMFYSKAEMMLPILEYFK
jgi:hypothetical protein